MTCPFGAKRTSPARPHADSLVVHHRISRSLPLFDLHRRVAHHDLDEQRNQKPDNLGAVSDLTAVHASSPRRAAVHQLVAQRVEPAEQDIQNGDDIFLRKGARDLRVGPSELVSPPPEVMFVRMMVMMPERSKDVTVLL